jgi:hypothetical protein
MFRDNRLVDSSPKRDIDRCDVVGRTSESARLTSKPISRRPVSLRDMPARRTRSGSVTRIDEYHRYSDDLGFVFDEGSEKVEVPSMQVATLSLVNRYPRSYALEIFEGDRSLGVFGFRNQLLGNAVVHILRESGHPTRKLLQMAFCGLGVFALESGFQRIKSVSGFVDLLARMDLTVRVNREVLDTKIGTENTSRVKGRFFRNFNHNAKVERAFEKDQVGLALDSVHPSLLVFSKSDRNQLSPPDGGDGHPFKSFPSENPLIVDDGTVKPKLWFDRLVSFVGFSNLGYGPNRELRRETEPLTNVVVNNLMDLDLVGGVHRKSGLRNVITCFVEAMHGIEEKLVLFISRIEFNHQGLKHYTEQIVQWIYSFRTASSHDLSRGYPAWSFS